MCIAHFSPRNMAASQLFDLMNVDADDLQYPPGLADGFYRLCFDDNATRGANWTIGTGSRSLPSPNVDIQLYPQASFLSSRTYHDHIDPKHACLFVHPVSGVLMLQNLSMKPITCTGYDAKGNLTTSACTISARSPIIGSCYVLHRRVTRLDFGPLSFEVQIRKFDYSRFIRLRDNHLRVDRRSLPIQLINPFALLDKTSMIKTEDVAIFAEVSSSLSGGVKLTTGNPYVVKHSVMDPNHLTRRHEYGLMLAFSKGRSQGLLQTVCSPSSRPKEGGAATYTMGMALFSFHSYFSRLGPAVLGPAFLGYVRGSLRGLHSLHSSGIAHESVNPHTILLLPDIQDGLVKGPADMRAVICPIVKAVTQETDSNWRFLAPRSGRGRGDRGAADIWALGATWHWALTVNKALGDVPRESEKKEVSIGQLRADGVLYSDFWALLKKMMAHDPSSRPTTQDVLDDVFWTHVEENGSPRPRAAKRAKTAHAAADGIVVAKLPK